ncbi:MAG: hypothetical protein ACI3V0_02555 [Faecousia sp.]
MTVICLVKKAAIVVIKMKMPDILRYQAFFAEALKDPGAVDQTVPGSFREKER